MRELLYFYDSYQDKAKAQVLSTGCDEQGSYCVLDKTIFYPQGGGQPSDQGTIDNLAVVSVRRQDGEVRHYSSHAFVVGSEVELAIDAERRALHCRLHTAGHLLSAITEKLYPYARAVKGHHYPDGSYVEFENVAAVNLERINNELSEEIARDLCITVQNSTPRLVQIGNYQAVACGGTHVKSLQELSGLTATKHKAKGNSLRISYRLSFKAGIA